MSTVMGSTTVKVLDAVKNNPGATSRLVASEVGCSVQTAALSLSTLFRGRYIVRTKGEQKAENGNRLWEYTHKSDTPRKLRRDRGKTRRKAEVCMVVQDNPVEILVAVKDSKQTLALTPAQVRSLFLSLKALLNGGGE